MSAYDIRVIVLSKDNIYKSQLSNGLRKDIELEIIPNTFDIVQAKSLLSKNKPNMLIIDIENQTVTDSYLKILLENYNLKLLIVGAKPGLKLTTVPIKDTLHKPVVDNPLLWNIYIRDMIKRIKSSFNIATSPVFESTFGDIDVNHKLILIASSTGGTEALPALLNHFPANMPPILIVQHMPLMFTKQFADRLNKTSKIKVKEAISGEYLKKNTAFIAPGDFHMKVIKKASKLAIETVFSDKVHGVRPSADVLFNSVLNISTSKNLVGIILTGMGADGARGLYELHNKGAKIIAQSKESCVVYGMPKVAVDLGAVDYILPLNKIAEKIIELSR